MEWMVDNPRVGFQCTNAVAKITFLISGLSLFISSAHAQRRYAGDIGELSDASIACQQGAELVHNRDSECRRRFDALILQSQQRPAHRQVALYIDLGHFDAGMDGVMGGDRLLTAQSQFPGITTLYFRAETLDQLQHQLSRVTDEVAWLYLSGDGSREQIYFSHDRTTASDAPISLTDLGRLLGSLHFAPDVRIMMNQCNLLEGDPSEIMQQLRESLGLHSGLIYANEGAGSDVTEILFSAAPAYSTSRRTRGFFVTLHLILPMSLPLALVADHIAYNHGWVDILTPDGHCFYPASAISVYNDYF